MSKYSQTLSLSQALEKASPGTRIDIYTDGSHAKRSCFASHSKVPGGYIGYGAYCQFGGNEYHLSGDVDPQKLSQYRIDPKTVVSNPTAEFLAFAQVLTKLSKVQNSVVLVFHIDYIGVKNWMSGAWRAKKTYIRLIKERSKQIISQAGFQVEIKHVRGHSGVPGNEEADLMAKREETLDQFS